MPISRIAIGTTEEEPARVIYPGPPTTNINVFTRASIFFPSFFPFPPIANLALTVGLPPGYRPGSHQRGSAEETHPNTLKAAVAEFISTLIFVFAGQGSGIAFNKLTSDGATTPAGLVASSIAHGFGLFVAVAVGANISGGHVNPAVTFGAFVGGNITLLRAIRYWIAQLLGSTVACLLLQFTTSLDIETFGLSSGVGLWQAVVLEIVMTFGLVYTVNATAVDPKKGTLGTIAPIAIGFIVGANILVGGAFTGACMNPALAFGPAVVILNWPHHWIYWVGPLLGGGLAGVVYEILFISQTHEPLASDY